MESRRKRRWGKLVALAEKSKIELSTEEESSIYMTSFSLLPEEDDLNETLTRNDLAEIIQDAIEGACVKIDQAISQAGINDINIEEVLLTGGTCSITAIQDRLKEKFGHRVKVIDNADLVIAQGAAVISELGWFPFLTKDIQVELCDDSYWPLFESGMPIAPNEEAVKKETFTCVDQRNKVAKVIISEGVGQSKDKNLAILNVPVLAHRDFGDDIYLEARLDKDIVLYVNANSKMVNTPSRDKAQEYSVRKSAEIYKMCFGLDIMR